MRADSGIVGVAHVGGRMVDLRAVGDSGIE
jgi:hypothetical protein